MLEALALSGFVALMAAGLLRARTQARSSEALPPDWDAADRGRRLSGWTPRRTSPRSELVSAGTTLLARSRDAVRNNPYAARAIRVRTSALIGPGLTPQFESRSPARNVKLAGLYKRWAKKPGMCDRRGRLSIGAMQALAVRTMDVSGGVLIRRWWAPGQEVPIQLELLEPDLIDVGKNSSSPRIDRGLELDERERIVAIWILPSHPGDQGSWSMAHRGQSTRVSVDDIRYCFWGDRAGALGGVPTGTASLPRLRQLDEYDIATLTRQQISATMVGGIIPGDAESAEDPTAAGNDEVPIGRASAYATDVDGNPVATMENGAWTVLEGGKAVQFFDPPTPVDSQWKKDELHAIGAGYGVPYMLLTGDLSEASYSSMKQGSGEFYDQVDADREHTIIPHLCDAIGEWFVEACYAAVHTTERDTPMSWAARRRPSIDPNKEIQADVQGMESGLESQPDLLQRRGYDPDQFLRDQVEWKLKQAQADAELKKKLEAAGLSGDPPTGGGGAGGTSTP